MTSCIFCDFSKIKERTIATLNGVRVVVTLGQITNGGYILLIPTIHSSCLGALTKDQISSFENILSLATCLLEDEYQSSVTIFEHGMVGQTIKHSHLHLLPANINLTKVVSSNFPDAKIESIANLSQLSTLFQKRQEPYLLWSTPKNNRGTYKICWNPPAQPEYFRLAVANKLRVPERGSWRNMDPVLDKKLADETMERLFPLFNL